MSRAMEDYIAAIWRLTLHGGTASTGAVARRLGVSPASTSYMFRKLAEAGLVDHKEYAGATLTPAGERAAAGYIRRHRLTERFLVDILGIPWDQVDAITDQMEHALPDVVVDRIDDVLGHPRTCPHGYPIPDRSGNVDEIAVRPLTELRPGETAVVARVAEHDPQLLAHLGDLGLFPRTEVQVLARDRVGDTYRIRVGNREHVVGRAVAAAVYVADA
ncbi:metal-dependent transcriptional regulator [Caldinitratiruptor microaerophilus]|uniref:Manganese transport regulator n=1 Tax=Caldinitratiruptor microaerophilus TaxID=671077 RepID=A0AA35CLQ3_9FIRM|nr:metal-dependent transcriptional regulator [Caldinitratiruptor microaerophilus]BDG59621.1 transcriptional regulator [Caldinitratiruptor microaerophilus]